MEDIEIEDGEHEEEHSEINELRTRTPDLNDDIFNEGHIRVELF